MSSSEKIGLEQLPGAQKNRIKLYSEAVGLRVVVFVYSTDLILYIHYMYMMSAWRGGSRNIGKNSDPDLARLDPSLASPAPA